MTSESYRQILNSEFESKEMSKEDFNNTLMHFAMLYHKEQSEIENHKVIMEAKKNCTQCGGLGYINPHPNADHTYVCSRCGGSCIDPLNSLDIVALTQQNKVPSAEEKPKWKTCDCRLLCGYCKELQLNRDLQKAYDFYDGSYKLGLSGVPMNTQTFKSARDIVIAKFIEEDNQHAQLRENAKDELLSEAVGLVTECERYFDEKSSTGNQNSKEFEMWKSINDFLRTLNQQPA